ncbi:hypothetical protein [Bdellovibrio sp. GT3]|uniref:hypothetical protein n=1 Tax=Bdellovibrio sp. GT3 TaxID=3136282 RepID=UPI0030F2BCBB
MIRAVVVHIMIVFSLLNIWSVGFASQFDDCCESQVELTSGAFHDESSQQVKLVSESHQDEDCATQCVDCVICHSQCNQHGLMSFSSQLLGIELQQVYRAAALADYSEAPLRSQKEPPRV